MKKLTATLIASSLMAVAAFAQGQLLFQNFNSVGLSAPMFEADGTTKLSGASFQASLIDTDHGNAILAQAGFLTGTGAGLFLGGTVTVAGTPAGSVAHLQVDIWNTAFGSTFAAASASAQNNAWAQSPILNITLTGAPSPPASLTGITSMSLNAVPEPSSLALAGLGAAALLVFRRRK